MRQVLIMRSIVENLKRATIETILLSLLTEEDKYGYQLAQEIKKRTDNKLSILEGSMYTILNRLKDNGDVTLRTELAGKKMTRVYYHITDSGREHLDEMVSTYDEYIGIINTLIKHS